MPEYVRITPSGRQQFVRSHSFSHHHHHHHRSRYLPRCPDNCASISVEQWEKLCDQNKDLFSLKEALTRENETLKNEVQAVNTENIRLRELNQQLDGEVHELRRALSRDGDNTDRFRRRVAALKAELDQKEHALRHLEKENATLGVRVRELTRTVTDQGDEIAALLGWKRRCEDFERRYEKARRSLADHAAELKEYKIVIDEQRYVRRRDSVPRRHWYSFA
ncbi:hypothetical protein F5X99DRAFT_422986 [Biscogniauxia marginata]|nr:hypothetical protein F5X99DRAFT_422986 [Biscogniauxia marginata]